MTLSSILRQVCIAIVGTAFTMSTPPSSFADFDDPKPKVDCTKKKNKDKPECKANHQGAIDDEIYNAAYWLARSEKYAEALEVLKHAKNPDTPRLLNETGFATRKLGDVDGALEFYRRALALDPNYVFARAYLGEAYLTKGDMASAKSELSQIEKRCGTSCTAYNYLAPRIATAEAQGSRGG